MSVVVQTAGERERERSAFVFGVLEIRPQIPVAVVVVTGVVVIVTVF